MRAHHVFSLLFISMFTIQALAQAKSKPIEANRMMSITYGSSSWNTDSTKIDEAFLIMKDKNSGKLVRIQLDETAPDSSEFNGQFSVNLGDSEKIAPEVYIPPAEIRSGAKDYKKLHELIQSGRLPRKPLIWKKNEKGQSLLDVYDTREQAEAALKAYNEQQKIAKEIKNQPAVNAVKTDSEAAIAAAREAERAAELAKLALEAAQRESERVRMEQIEMQKAEERARQAKLLSEKQRAERRARAQGVADEANALFLKGDFDQAEKKYQEAIDLDPENKSYYLNYGITLYRNDKFNDALVIFKLAKAPPGRQLEKNYYMGLTHYRLKELDFALQQLAPVAASNDRLAPSASFYMGVIRFAKEDYKAAKTDFERVIDTSTDPRMDEQAEEYLERIIHASSQKALRDKRWTLTGVVGAQYDSNVLLTSDQYAAQGTATNVADFRAVTVGDVEYRAVYTDKHEVSTKANANLTNSAKSDSAPADPYLFNFSVPYSYKSMAFAKPYKLSVKPAYEYLMMDADSDGTKTAILTSYLVDVDNTFVMRANHFAIYSLGIRSDDSNVTIASDEDDASALKVSVKTTQGFYLDKGRKEILLANLGYTLNSAAGDNKTFNRIDLGATYSRPFRWESTMAVNLAIYSLKYPDASESRDDFNTTLTFNVSKPIREWVKWDVAASYSKNNSNLEANEYSKYLIMTTATFTTSF